MSKNSDKSKSNQSVKLESTSQKNVKAQFGTYLIATSWRVALPMLGFSLGGHYLDSALSSKPTLTIIGLLLGCAGAWFGISKYMKDNSLSIGGAK